MKSRPLVVSILLVAVCLLGCLSSPSAALAATPAPGCQIDGLVPDPSSQTNRAAGDDPTVTPGDPTCDGTSYDYDYPDAAGATDAPEVAVVGGGTSAPRGELPRTGDASVVGLLPIGLLGFLSILAGVTLCCVPTSRSNVHA